jgi:hypothetical protein
MSRPANFRALLAAGAALLVFGAQAQDVTKPEPIAAAPANVQFFAGFWNRTESDMGMPPARPSAAFKPQAAAQYDVLVKNSLTGVFQTSRTSGCTPMGWPEMLGLGAHFEANADYITQFGGEGPSVRFIWLNKKHHPSGVEQHPTFSGDDIGHWEGDTLVVDIVGVDPTNEQIYGMSFNDPQLHATERYRMIDSNTFELKTTIVSPKALYKPWNYREVYKRQAMPTQIFYCTTPLAGQSLDLTPPEGGYIPPGAKD